MDFPKEELLGKYVNIYEKYIADYIPDFEVKDGTTRYVRFNDAWRELDPYEKLLICRLLNRKNTFPKKPLQKLPKNSDPQNYVKLKYDSDGNLKAARIGEGKAHLIYCTIIHLLFNFLTGLVVIDQHRLVLVIAIYAMLYLFAGAIVIIINKLSRPDK